MNEIDADEDRTISFALFSPIWSELEPAIDGWELKETFEVFDEDHDGRISVEELHKMFVEIEDEKCVIEDCRDMKSVVDVVDGRGGKQGCHQLLGRKRIGSR